MESDYEEGSGDDEAAKRTFCNVADGFLEEDESLGSELDILQYGKCDRLWKDGSSGTGGIKGLSMASGELETVFKTMAQKNAPHEGDKVKTVAKKKQKYEERKSSDDHGIIVTPGSQESSKMETTLKVEMKEKHKHVYRKNGSEEHNSRKKGENKSNKIIEIELHHSLKVSGQKESKEKKLGPSCDEIPVMNKECCHDEGGNVKKRVCDSSGTQIESNSKRKRSLIPKGENKHDTERMEKLIHPQRSRHFSYHADDKMIPAGLTPELYSSPERSPIFKVPSLISRLSTSSDEGGNDLSRKRSKIPVRIESSSKKNSSSIATATSESWKIVTPIKNSGPFAELNCSKDEHGKKHQKKARSPEASSERSNLKRKGRTTNAKRSVDPDSKRQKRTGGKDLLKIWMLLEKDPDFLQGPYSGTRLRKSSTSSSGDTESPMKERSAAENMTSWVMEMIGTTPPSQGLGATDGPSETPVEKPSGSSLKGHLRSSGSETSRSQCDLSRPSNTLLECSEPKETIAKKKVRIGAARKHEQHSQLGTEKQNKSGNINVEGYSIEWNVVPDTNAVASTFKSVIQNSEIVGKIKRPETGELRLKKGHLHQNVLQDTKGKNLTIFRAAYGGGRIPRRKKKNPMKPIEKKKLDASLKLALTTERDSQAPAREFTPGKSRFILKAQDNENHVDRKAIKSTTIHESKAVASEFGGCKRDMGKFISKSQPGLSSKHSLTSETEVISKPLITNNVAGSESSIKCTIVDTQNDTKKTSTRMNPSVLLCQIDIDKILPVVKKLQDSPPTCADGQNAMNGNVSNSNGKELDSTKQIRETNDGLSSCSERPPPQPPSLVNQISEPAIKHNVLMLKAIADKEPQSGLLENFEKMFPGSFVASDKLSDCSNVPTVVSTNGVVFEPPKVPKTPSTQTIVSREQQWSIKERDIAEAMEQWKPSYPQQPQNRNTLCEPFQSSVNPASKYGGGLISTKSFGGSECQIPESFLTISNRTPQGSMFTFKNDSAGSSGNYCYTDAGTRVIWNNQPHLVPNSFEQANTKAFIVDSISKITDNRHGDDQPKLIQLTVTGAKYRPGIPYKNPPSSIIEPPTIITTRENTGDPYPPKIPRTSVDDRDCLGNSTRSGISTDPGTFEASSGSPLRMNSRCLDIAEDTLVSNYLDSLVALALDDAGYGSSNQPALPNQMYDQLDLLEWPLEYE